jgi:prolipoprotein diacylglyceryl transferase
MRSMALAPGFAPLVASIPSPSADGIRIGPFTAHVYALCILAGIGVAVWLTRRRWMAVGGRSETVLEVALWSVLGGFVGARLYFVITSWDQVPDHWYGPFAIWDGGLGIWGGVLGGAIVGSWLLRRRGESVARFADAVAPGLIIAQGIGRLGNYFNQELFGGPTSLPWGLEIDPSHRPDRYLDSPTFHPTFLYELLWDVSFALLLIWIGRRFRIRPPGLFALYVAGYSFARIFEELLRVDPSHHFLGQRVNFYVALLLCLGGLAWFVWTQRHRPAEERPPVGPVRPAARSRPG